MCVFVCVAADRFLSNSVRICLFRGGSVDRAERDLHRVQRLVNNRSLDAGGAVGEFQQTAAAVCVRIMSHGSRTSHGFVIFCLCRHSVKSHGLGVKGLSAGTACR